MEKHVKLNSNFYLTTKELNMGQAVKKTKSLPTNFLFVIDVSGSMYYDLALIRKQLKNKLPSLVKEGDTITLIWFSGRDQAGILKEEVEVKALTDLQHLNEAIDRYLKAVCLTAFAKPLVLAKEAIERMKKNRPDSVFSLIFLTDGYNNDCSWSDVMTSLKNLDGDLAASTFVEYGYYADTRRVTEMAETIGGEKVDAAHFDDYDVLFEAKMQKSYSSSKKVVVELPNSRKFNFAFILNQDEILLYSVNENNEVLVPENTKAINYFSTEPVGLTQQESDKALLYGALYVLSDKLQYDDAEYIFQELGDVHLYSVFANAYGKQKLISFKNLVKECVTDESKRFSGGYSASLQVDENAYCVMNLIDDLTKDDDAVFFPFHEDFNYKRIGVKKVQQTGLTDDEKQELLKSTTLKEAKEIIEKADGRDLKFEYADKDKGHTLRDLVWSSNRANLSVRVRYEGFVKLPENKYGIDKIDTFIYRNYTIIKDGILNLSKLPITISNDTLKKITDGGVKTNWFDLKPEDVLTIDFSSLPIVNKKMVSTISAKKLGAMEYNLFELKALEKVYKYYEAKHFPRVSQGFIDLYGTEAEAWLKEIGITQFNGFAPKTTTAEGSDMYMAVELNTKMAKHSSLPKVDLVIGKYESGKKLNPAETLMAVAIKDYETQIASPIYSALTDEKLRNDVLSNWLTKAKLNIRVERRRLLQEIAQIKFSLILSKKWFEEFASFDEDSLVLKPNSDASEVTFKFEMKEKEIAV